MEPALVRPLTFTEQAIIVDLIRDEPDPKRLAAMQNEYGRRANRTHRKWVARQLWKARQAAAKAKKASV